MKINEKIDTDEKVEDDSDKDDTPIPHQYEITSYGADYTVEMIIGRLKKGKIFVPDFQRGYVWTVKDASRFVESLLLGLPVPGIFLAVEKNTNKRLIIDGQQRLESLRRFYDTKFNGKPFKLKGVQGDLNGKTYHELSEWNRNRLDESTIHATIVEQTHPSEENINSGFYHIFERLNTGGRALHPQEIRSCLYHGDFNNLLSKMNKIPEWREIFRKIHGRMKDQELILRFLALFFNEENYQRPMKSFLNAYMEKNRNLPGEVGEKLEEAFSSTIKFIHNTIGKKAFRPDGVINAAVFDSSMVGTARRLSKGEIVNTEDFKQVYEKLLSNEHYRKPCRKATSDEKNVRDRIRLATEKFDQVK